MTSAMRKLLLTLPPFQLLPPLIVNQLERRQWYVFHLAILCFLYGIVFISAGYEHTIYIRSGIGIVQNPPFLAHIICGVFSLGLPIVVTKRIVKVANSDSDNDVLPELLKMIKVSKLRIALFAIGFLIGIMALSSTIALSTSTTINIYDSIRHPITFISYLLLRSYLFLFCYPFMFCGTIVIVYYLFRALRFSSMPYRPFHSDEMGGFRKYFNAIDRPIYGIQSLTVLVGVSNYLGWGGMFTVPIIFAIAAPTIISGFAFLLLIGFRRLLKIKKELEIRDIRSQQMNLYPQVKHFVSLSPNEGIELLKRIESMEYLIGVIKKKREAGWGKYVVNAAIAIAGQVVKPLTAVILSHLIKTP